MDSNLLCPLCDKEPLSNTTGIPCFACKTPKCEMEGRWFNQSAWEKFKRWPMEMAGTAPRGGKFHAMMVQAQAAGKDCLVIATFQAQADRMRAQYPGEYGIKVIRTDEPEAIILSGLQDGMASTYPANLKRYGQEVKYGGGFCMPQVIRKSLSVWWKPWTWGKFKEVNLMDEMRKKLVANEEKELFRDLGGNHGKR